MLLFLIAVLRKEWEIVINEIKNPKMKLTHDQTNLSNDNWRFINFKGSVKISNTQNVSTVSRIIS